MFAETSNYLKRIASQGDDDHRLVCNLSHENLSNIHVLSSLLAACFHIILPSNRTKCRLRQPNFAKFLWEARPRTFLDAHSFGACLVGLLVGSGASSRETACLRACGVT